MSRSPVRPAIAMISCRLSPQHLSSISELVSVVALHDQSTDLVTVYDHDREVVCTTHVHCLLNIRHLLAWRFHYTHWLFVDDDDEYDLQAIWRLAFKLTNDCDILHFTRERVKDIRRTDVIECVMRAPAWWQRFTSAELIRKGAYDKGYRRPGEDRRFMRSVRFMLNQNNVRVVCLKRMPYAHRLALPSVCCELHDATSVMRCVRARDTCAKYGWIKCND